MKTPFPNDTPAQSLPVIRHHDFRAKTGASEGEPISFADELVMDDVYELMPGHQNLPLTLRPTDDGYVVGRNSAVGVPGARVHLDSILTLMSSNNAPTDAMILVEVDDEGAINDIYLLPFAKLEPRLSYALVGIDREAAAERLAELACARFARGTHITLASGEQRRIEDLSVGDRVLTRDDGAQPIRWIGESTVRAVGDFAPIRIKAGALNNASDLILSPDHRLFIYQRQDALGLGRSEILIKARHLVNGSSVVVDEGGFVDYFLLLFDTHQIIYAEGIAAESMLIDMNTRPAAPNEVTDTLVLSRSGLADLEIGETLPREINIAEILRRASSR
ncbi:MAG: Hint domain-containing protein [Pseudomonadota bacterium]